MAATSSKANGERTGKEISKCRAVSPTKAEIETSKGRDGCTGAFSLLVTVDCWKALGDREK